MESVQVTETKTTTTTTSSGTGGGSGRPGAVTGLHAISVAILFVASVIEFVSAARVCDKADYCEKEFGWALACGLVSTFLLILFALYQRFATTVNHLVTKILAIFLLVWWAAGMGVCTFRAPFVATGNGYFSCWIAFIASIYFANEVVPELKSVMQKVYNSTTASTEIKVLWFLFVASVIELTAAANLCDNTNCEDEIGWAVAVGAISLLIAILLVFLVTKLGQFKIFVSIPLLGLWCFGVGVLTFDAPFTFTGNGYFSSWAAFFAAVGWCYLTLTERFTWLRRG